MKKLILLLLLCILLTAGSFDADQYSAVPLTEEEALVKSFESTGAEVMESTISCWTKLNDRFIAQGQIEAEMDRIVGFMKLDNTTVVKKVENDETLNKLVLYGTRGNKAYNVAIESAKQETGGETYIVFDVFMDKDYKELASVRQEIIDALQQEEASMNFSSCIVGTYKGELSKKESDRKSELALQSIDAKRVEGIEDDMMKSISAFSNNVGGYVLSDRDRVNVQLAMRYSSYDDKTYIWIGTPLIPMGY
ncbi:MAG TPA: YwmB family TATA-box binding protein [Clostridia bacterium]|nr:YwmB family TATA-box binding protein [Clostridia bacterium]